VLMHELGHQVGLADLYMSDQVSQLMYGYAFVGERRLPQGDDLAAADADHPVHGAYLLSPITIGTLPETQAVEVQFTSTVNNFTNQVIPNFNNTTTVNFNPGAGSTVSAPEALVIDSLTLGGTIWRDDGTGGGIAGNGVRDGTEGGIDGVALSLFVDANNDNVADTPGTALLATLTAGGGNYSLAGLAPGNYIVRADADNFDAGGNVTLLGLSSSAGSPDPDGAPDVDNDDNGFLSAGAAFSNAITLAYNSEPTAGTGNDTNNTLDFGFVALNQAPVNTVPGAQNLNEDGSLTFSGGGGNAISISDADAGSANLTVTLSVNHGTLTLGGTAGLSFANGDGTTDAAMTFSGTSAAINTALTGLVYAPAANFNGADSLLITTSDNGNSGADPGLTGGPNDERDNDSVAITINSVNDAPSGVDDSATIGINASYFFSAADFNFSDPVEGHGFAGVVITSLPTNGTLFLAATPVVAGQFIVAGQIDTELNFVPDSGESGTPYATFTFQVRDNGGTANGGVATDPSANTFTFNVTASAAPVVDLNGATGGIDSAASYTEGSPAVVLAPGAVVTDADTATLSSATVSIAAGFLNGFDVLTLNGATSGAFLGISFAYTAATGVLTLNGVAPVADYQAALRTVGFLSTSGDPGTSRTISWTANDGALNSATALTSVTVTGIEINAPPVTGGNASANGSENDGSVGGTVPAASDPDAGDVVTYRLVAGSVQVGGVAAVDSAVRLHADGSFSRATGFDDDLNAGDSRIITFDYVATDGLAVSAAATITITINGSNEAVPVAGTNGDDVITGSIQADVIWGGSGNDTLSGLEDGDRLEGGNNDDTLQGGLGNDLLFGGPGTDALYGGDDIDFVRAGQGNDLVNGEDGDDTLFGDLDEDLVLGGAGNDTLHGGAGNDRLEGGNDDDVLHGDAGNDLLFGGPGIDVIFGGNDNDTILAGQSNDIVDGGSGSDTIRGDLGQDDLTGGADADLFRFTTTAQSTVAAPDRILDFVQGIDQIDLSAIDAISGSAGDDPFTFIGAVAFSGAAGELRSYDSLSGSWFVEGDVDGDGNADFRIEVFTPAAPAAPLGGGDFVP
jgi:hypothetical protein